MKNLDPYVIPLESINLIEASAGTGKSWTVTLLYLRLILEKGLTVDQILVVTFTDAATKELRDDIRNRLSEALAAFKDLNYSKDDEYSRLLRKIATDDKDECIRRLTRAKLSLDEASIFTIHSFCQRALTENAFQAGLPFESELMDDDRELMQKLVDDYWRRNLNQAPEALLFKLEQKSITPDSLLKDIYTAVGKPYLEVIGPDIVVDIQQESRKWDELDKKFKQAIACWNQHRDEIYSLLTKPALKKAYYKVINDEHDLIFSAMDNYSRLNKIPADIEDKNTHWLGTKEKTKSGYDSIEHPFFKLWQDFLDSWKALNESSDVFLNQIRIQLLKYLQKELPKEKLKLGVLSFDDLLLQLQKALRCNPLLAQAIRKKYKAALIDEFQDTDPIQYEIFHTIFGDQSQHAVFLVGDPKQAIYSFRGGDIHTYLKAKSDTSEENHYTLKTNWRSHPDLISAFNNLYSASDNPFQDQGIDYIEVDAGGIVKDKLTTPDKRSSLRFWTLETELEDNSSNGTNNAKNKRKSLPKLRDEIANAVAGDIATLLKASQEGSAKIGEKNITGGDIAVLVRSHSQGDLIKQALNTQGIASVQSSKDSIFDTHEAAEMYRLLTAIADPQREDNIRRALATDLMGYDAKSLLSFEDDNNAWEDKLLAMQQWHNQWLKKGFLPMMRDFMRSEKTHQHLLAYEDGERRLTNFLHLSEIIHNQSKKHAFSIEDVLRWLQQQFENTSSKDTELRLESDRNLVKIVTIHKSKGLEYPIVYCPFVGITSKDMDGSIFIFHKDKKAYLEVGSKEAGKHKAIKTEENRAEDSRLLYVALTRAKYQCTVVCVPEAIKKSPDKTALGWLLTNGKRIKSGATRTSDKLSNKMFFQAYSARLNELSAHQSTMVVPLPIYTKKIDYHAQQAEQELIAREFNRKIINSIRVTSFSGLTANAHSEAPDYDTAPSENSAQLISTSNTNNSENAFPKGATAGTALHEIFENIDFTLPINDQSKIISDVLNKWAFDAIHEDAATALIGNSLKAELFSGFSLQQLEKHNRLDEMEFYLPLNKLQFDDLQQVLYQYLPVEWETVRNAVKTLYFEKVEGYLKGYIDLIFEHQGKYYVADYKSNTLNDYHQESLLNTMADSHYYLQSLLYSVALHRYLQKHLIDYSWETHFGGAYYLFIRGMNSLKKGGGGINTDTSGVFFHKPTVELITAMDNLFGEAILT